MIKIDIISGFLGAGKTTFIKKILKEALAGEQVVLIENEFGEIGIDGGFLKEAGVEIREMNSGCICCSLVGDFEKSLSEVLIKYSPDRVIIEPSGVGKLSDVMKAVKDVGANIDVVLNSATTIVDASKCKMYMKNFGEFFNNQIEHATTIVLSRTDVADPKKVEQDLELIRQYNKEAEVVTTPCSQLNGKQLLDIMENADKMKEQLLSEVKEEVHQHHKHGEECGCGGHHREGHEHGQECGCGSHHHEGHEHGQECGCGGHHHDHAATEVFSSWGLEHAEVVSRQQLEEVLEELAYGDQYGEVLRAKGMVPGENSEWFYFDLVPEEVEIRTGSPEYTGKVCVIGANLNEERLKKAFSRSL